MGLNVCECGGKAGSHFGRRVSSHSCLAKVLKKADFSGLSPPPNFTLAGICVAWFQSRVNDREYVCGHNSQAWR